MNTNLLIEKANQVGVVLTTQMIEQFSVYMENLLEWNSKVNLTSVIEPDEIILKHFVDSIASSKLLTCNCCLCDIGTGAGFPGVPLKIVRPDIKVVLMDSLNKRILFLNDLISVLKLDGIRSVHMRAEDAGQSLIYREKFDFVTARAVAKLNTLSEYALPLVRVGGAFLAYKSNYESELIESERALSVLGGKLKQIVRFSFSESCENRAILVVEKEKSTPKRFPRGKNKEREEPIV